MQETMLKNSWSSLTTWMTHWQLYNQSKEIRSMRWMGNKLCFRVNNSELWAVRQALIPMISHCHSHPTPDTHALSNSTAQ